jgi:hypothetical protein
MGVGSEVVFCSMFGFFLDVFVSILKNLNCGELIGIMVGNRYNDKSRDDFFNIGLCDRLWW